MSVHAHKRTIHGLPRLLTAPHDYTRPHVQVPKLVAVSWIINTANERTDNKFDLIGIAKIVHNQTDRTLLKVDEQVDDVLTEHEMVVAVLREEADTVKQLR